MRPSFLHWLLCIAAVVGAVVGITLLQAGAAHASSGALPEDPRFKCIPSEHTLCIHYMDFQNLPHRFSCQVDPDLARKEEASFGYPLDGETILKELDQRLSLAVKLQAGPMAAYVHIPSKPHVVAPRTEELPFLAWEYQYPILNMDEVPIQRRAEARWFENKIKPSLALIQQRIYDDYYAERGFRRRHLADENGRPIYDIAYKGFADRARPLLTDCFGKFAQQTGIGDDQEVMAQLSALFQEITFELPKNENDLYKAGYRTPLAVLQRNRGDCDSKSVALCSIWRSPGPQMILLLADLTEEEKASVPPELRSSQHAFLGYQSSAGNGTVRAGVLHYTLYEASHGLAPDAEKLPPGRALLSSAPQRGICLTDDCCGQGESNCRVYEDAPGAR